ncbi:MAG: PQQ-binding-like beta-propeller repeat protein [bacterium]
MAQHALITALGGYDVHWWHIALAVVVAAAVCVGGFFAVRALWPVVSEWSRWQQAGAAGVIALAIAGAAYAIYGFNDRPSDVLNEGVDFEQNEPEKVIETVNWPVYGYDDQRTRYLPSKLVQPPFRSSDWSFQAGKLLEFSPIAVKDRLYFVDKDALVYAMASNNGKVRWKHRVGALSAASPAYEDGRLFVVTLEPGDIQAMDPRSGKILWERPLPGRSESSPLVYGNKVIVGTEPGTVFAFDVKTGKVEWSLDTPDAVKGGVALDEGIIYFGNYAGELYAVNAANGEVKWQTGTQGSSFGRTGRIYSTPAVAFGRVYVGSVDNRIYSFDQDTGELAWSHSTGDWVYPAPAVAEVPGGPPTVYIGSLDQNFYALDARDGSVRWQKDVGGVILGAASVIGDVAYVGVIGPKNGTFGFDADTGKQVFEHELGEYNPVISDGKRLYLTGASGIRAFSPDLHPDRKKPKGKEAADADGTAAPEADG